MIRWIDNAPLPQKISCPSPPNPSSPARTPATAERAFTSAGIGGTGGIAPPGTTVTTAVAAAAAAAVSLSLSSAAMDDRESFRLRRDEVRLRWREDAERTRRIVRSDFEAEGFSLSASVSASMSSELEREMEKGAWVEYVYEGVVVLAVGVSGSAVDLRFFAMCDGSGAESLAGEP